MRILFVVVLAFISLNTFCFAEAVPGEYLVKLRSYPTGKRSLNMFSQNLGGAKVQMVLPSQNVVLIKPDSATISNGDVLDKVRANPNVEFIQPNYRYRTSLHLPLEKFRKTIRAFETGFELPTPTSTISKPAVRPAPANPTAGVDPLINQDTDLELANAKRAWAKEAGNPNVVVAVIDTGVDYNHEDLAGNMWHSPSNPNIVGWDFAENDALPYDVTAPINPFTGEGNPGHGTHCAGNVGAVGDNALGTSGIAKHVSIMAIRLLTEKGQGDTTAAVKSIDYAVANGAHIVSASWGSEGSSEGDELIKEAIKRAEAKNVLFVAAAGNTSADDQASADNDNNAERRAYPASFDLPNILSVAASNQKGEMADFTHFGATTVDIAAPGAQSFSTVPMERSKEAYPSTTGYEDTIEIQYLGKAPWNGTSMATPQVAGAAALVLSQHPDWTYAQVKKQLMDTARAEATLAGKTVTGGVLDVAKAVE